MGPGEKCSTAGGSKGSTSLKGQQERLGNNGHSESKKRKYNLAILGIKECEHGLRWHDRAKLRCLWSDMWRR